MTQTEQIAQQAFDRPKHSANSTSDASFAPASALTAKVPIDFKKLQLFKGRCRAYELRACSPLLRDDALPCLAFAQQQNSNRIINQTVPVDVDP